MKLGILFSPLALLVLFGAASGQAQTNSQPRVLRLSFVEGHVTVEKPDVQGWADAPVNTPLQQGFSLATGEGSFAEIQLEDGSAIRIGEQSRIEMTELGRNSDGGRVNRLGLREGYATFHATISSGSGFLEIETPLGRFTANSEAEFRVDLAQGMERVEVFDGEVREESSLGAETLAKDSVLVMQQGASEPVQLSQGITQDDWDQWVADRETRVEQAAEATVSPDSDGAPYGWADLEQNGTWEDVEGAGRVWLPPFVVGWSPYSSGRWCWYPNWGFVWIGSEPWGWVPYHYGSWEYLQGRGWAWAPGNLKTWSPARVTWYQGQDWIGWRPRTHRKDTEFECRQNCGGGVISAGAMAQGGLITPHTMLGVNIAGVNRVNAPHVSPASSATLTGAPAAYPASQVRRTQWTVSRPQSGTWAAAPARPSTAWTPRPGAGSANAGPGIVYDPQQGTYVNGHRSTRPIVQPGIPAGSGNRGTTNPWAASPAQNPASVTAPARPNPAASQPVIPPLGGQGRPTQGVYATPPQATTNTNNPGANHSGAGPGQPGAAQSGGAQSGSNRGGAWGPGGGQSGNNQGGGWAPAGGSNRAAAPAPNNSNGRH